MIHKIIIHTSDGMKEIGGIYTNKYLAIHKTYLTLQDEDTSNKWTITHCPTGHAITQGRIYKDIEKVIEKLTRNIEEEEWNKTVEEFFLLCQKNDPFIQRVRDCLY